MENVVYFLGAGFSAPLGLPVMRDFLLKSRDMYFGNRQKYDYFGKVFERIDTLHKAGTYYNTDLFNIEEILSVLEMQDLHKGTSHAQLFQKYIGDVIKHFTPTPDCPKSEQDDYRTLLVGGTRWAGYGAFVANLCSLTAHLREGACLSYEVNPPAEYETLYSVITLNYDTIVETALARLRACYTGRPQLPVWGELDKNEEAPGGSGLCVAKLHGSIDKQTIVPPTWNKAQHEGVLPAWRLAFRLLAEANYIRILGYSLPASDSYVPYLLRAAVLESQHLKGIDVICLDPDGSVRRRYDDFIDFTYYRYACGDVADYLGAVKTAALGQGTKQIRFNGLEGAHKNFMTRHM